ncbi:MAG: hypothetical protein AAGB46_19055 [Verrucomicrobiota bacterium]
MKALRKTVLAAGFATLAGSGVAGDWTVESQGDWQASVADKSNIELVEGRAVPTAAEAAIRSVVKRFPTKRSVKSFTLSQSPEWLNWNPVPNLGPSNLGDAPIGLQVGEGNYWMFGRYGNAASQKDGNFQAEAVSIEGYEIELWTTPRKNQFDAAGGLKPSLGGYHAWQSRDMKTWIHHGPVSERFSRWMTTAEYVDGKFYFYYDFPNDQDPHLYIDADPFDGLPGKNMGMAFKDPSHGSDAGVIRDLDGSFHIIAEDWSPIHAQTRAWDSPLAVRAVSRDGFNDFKIAGNPVDVRTTPTGEVGTYTHPHWVKEDPENYSTNVAEYQIHEPEQDAYGDWAAISVGGQYYLFADFDPAGSHGRESMSVAWFTSSDIGEPFTFCGNIGQGHPDPDILFAEGQFYLLTQMKTDYVSPGPWVETVEARLGVDTTNDGVIDRWSDWQVLQERYDYIEGFSKQVKKIPARLDLSELPEGYGFQFELRLMDSTENQSKPILDRLAILFED